MARIDRAELNRGSKPLPDRKPNRYSQLIERIFFSHYQDGDEEVAFTREEITVAAAALGLELPKNLGDVLYSFRYRTELPTSITSRAPAGKGWIIVPAGRARYRFVVAGTTVVRPNSALAQTKILDATPGMITRYALSDEQALLAILRYNRLVDVFTGVTCYSLQSHLRSSVKGLGQVEVDEVYIGVDRRGAQFVFPIQAKGGKDTLNVVQVQQDLALCRARFPDLICRPVGAQFLRDTTIALFELELEEAEIKIAAERHYRLVPPDGISPDELQRYAARTE